MLREVPDACGSADAGRRLPPLEVGEEVANACGSAVMAVPAGKKSTLPLPELWYGKGAVWGWWSASVELVAPVAKDVWSRCLRLAAAAAAAGVSRLPPPPHAGGRGGPLPLPAAFTAK